MVRGLRFQFVHIFFFFFCQVLPSILSPTLGIAKVDVRANFFVQKIFHLHLVVATWNMAVLHCVTSYSDNSSCLFYYTLQSCCSFLLSWNFSSVQYPTHWHGVKWKFMDSALHIQPRHLTRGIPSRI